MIHVCLNRLLQQGSTPVQGNSQESMVTLTASPLPCGALWCADLRPAVPRRVVLTCAVLQFALEKVRGEHDAVNVCIAGTVSAGFLGATCE